MLKIASKTNFVRGSEMCSCLYKIVQKYRHFSTFINCTKVQKFSIFTRVQSMVEFKIKTING